LALDGRRRKTGKPRTRWTDNVEDDLRKVGIKKWRLRTADRREQRGIYERPEFYKNCSATE
jgi:hypothetical protein